MNNLRLYLLLVFTLFQLTLNAQECECEDDTIVLCYFSTQEYCLPYINNDQICQYAFDGNYMKDGLVQKLENPWNFGPEGTVSCVFDIVPIVQPNSVEAIESQECDIIFTGSFAVDTFNRTVNINKTSISPNHMANIKEWSKKCDANLVITTQAEARLWGYDVIPENQNPNLALDNPEIFDGPFGTVTEFHQGGSFQGVFDGGGEAGYEPLAVDANGRLTVLIDSATNDIILGDIGLFCSFNVGWISDGPGIATQNDIFPLNIFALGCEIARDKIRTYQELETCKGRLVTLPNGQMTSSPGTFHSTLVASNNCDSIITTKISHADTLEHYIDLEACQGDGTTIEVGGISYDEQTPTGIEYFLTPEGCDSIVYIALDFLKSSTEEIQDSHCFNENYTLEIGDVIFDINHPSGSVSLVNSIGCDSVINVDIAYGEAFPQIELPDEITIDYGIPYEINLDIPSSFTVSWSPDTAVSCSNCQETKLLNVDEERVLQLEIQDAVGCVENYKFDIDVNCPVYVPNVFFPASINSANSGFTLGLTCPLDDFHLQIYDRWGALVFESQHSDDVWDGKINNEHAAIDVYGFYLKYSGFGKEYVQTGNLTLLR